MTLPELSKTVLLAWLPLVAALGYTTKAQAHGDEHADEPNTGPLISMVAPAASSPIAASDIVRDAPVPTINPSIGGQWSAVYDWPLVAVHAALLPNGKVLAWDATPDDSDDDPHTTDNYTTRVTLWDPIADTHQQTNNDTDTDLFCAGSAHLWDGRILFAGGDGGRAGANGPLANSNIYNPVTNTWHRTVNMNAPRWYSSVAALANGEMLTLGGTYEPSPLGEVFQFDQTWRALSGSYPIELTGDYQWLQQTPEGSVLSFGPSNLLLDIETENSGRYTAQTTRDSVENRDYGSYAMYTTGKILVAGGGQGLNTAVVIDTATRQTTDTTPLFNGRRQHNLTILADGSVLATGGNSDGAQYFSPTAPVMVPELWQPDTGRWTELNIIPTDRQYHSIAMLLPDGKVLSAGGGICGDCYALGYEERNAEIFNPPYLFNADGTLATRPALASVPTAADYAKSMFISVDHNEAISKAHLIKIGSVTHSENQDQRLVPLSFTQSNRRLTLTMPESRNVAPPGHYLLFVVDENGVPSEGSMIKVGQPLIGSQQLVKSTLEVDALDTYLTQPTQQAIEIELNALPATRLRVSASSFNDQTQSPNVLCTADVSSESGAVCRLNTEVGSQLYISVSGANRSDYTLVYRDTDQTIDNASPEQNVPDSPETVSNAGGEGQSEGNNGSEQPVASSDGVASVRVGGGFISGFLVLTLLISALIRVNCRLKRRV